MACIRRRPDDVISIIHIQEIHSRYLRVNVGSNIQKGAKNFGITPASEKVQRALASLVTLVSCCCLSQTFGPLNLSCESWFLRSDPCIAEVFVHLPIRGVRSTRSGINTRMQYISTGSPPVACMVPFQVF